MGDRGDVVNDKVTYALYALAVRDPELFEEAERFTGGMLTSDRRAHDRAKALLASVVPEQQQSAQLRERVEEIKRLVNGAMHDARNGLDLGLGCARDLEGDDAAFPKTPRSRAQDNYLRRARQSHDEIIAALDALPDGETYSTVMLDEQNNVVRTASHARSGGEGPSVTEEQVERFCAALHPRWGMCPAYTADLLRTRYRKALSAALSVPSEPDERSGDAYQDFAKDNADWDRKVKQSIEEIGRGEDAH